MPTYEYACRSEECKHRFEQVQRITEEPVKVCPKCGKETVERLVSKGSGFVLKGGGWTPRFHN